MRNMLAYLLASLVAVPVPVWAQRVDGGVRVNGTTSTAGVSTFTADTLKLDVANQDVTLSREAANVLGQRSGTTSQESRLYNTWTSATNFEAVRHYWAANVAWLVADKGSGGGTGRQLNIGTIGANALVFVTSGAVGWQQDSGGNLTFAGTENTTDIGAAGARRPRTAYLATSMNIAAGMTLKASADKLVQLNDNANATGIEFNSGTPTLGTCTGGTMTSGSHNAAGEVTGNTSGSCIINFGTPNFTNTPFCFINDETTLTAVRVSARSASSITVTGAVSADAFQFFCIGRIGT